MNKTGFISVRRASGPALSVFVIFLLAACHDPQKDITTLLKVSTLAGSSEAGFVDGIGGLARFNYPCGMTVDAGGNLYVADHSNHSIRKVTPSGVVTTFAGTGVAGAANGFRLEAQFNFPYGLAIDDAGNMYVGDVGNNRIRKISPDGVVTTLAGSRKGFADRNGTSAMFNNPYGVAVDGTGTVYVADTYNYLIRKVSPDGSVSTIAGNRHDGFVDGDASVAEFYVPIGIVVDASGNVYVGDEGNSSIRKITPDGVVSTLAGNGKFSFCDGIGKSAEFNAPGGIALDRDGNLYVADYLNNCVRMVSPEGEVMKLAGNLKKGFADGVAANAEFHYPFGIAVDAEGVIYVGDHYNHRIRKIN